MSATGRCEACGGLLGIDCFNTGECMAITRDIQARSEGRSRQNTGNHPDPLAAEIDDANELLEIVTTRAADFSRKAADDLYAALLEATQDYLIDNARFNIGERIASAERQARHDREAWGKAESRLTTQKAITADLLEALKALYHRPSSARTMSVTRPSTLHGARSRKPNPLSLPLAQGMLEMGEAFNFDTSGSVWLENEAVQWHNLSPGVQGCIAGMLGEINTKRCGWCGVKVVVAARKTGFGCGKHSQCTELVRDERGRLYIKGFSDLHHDTLARIIADWEKWEKAGREIPDRGNRTEFERGAALIRILLASGLTPYLNDEGKVCLRDAPSSVRGG